MFKAVARAMGKHDQALGQKMALEVARATAAIEAIGATETDVAMAAGEFMDGLSYKPPKDRRPPVADQLIEAVGAYVLRRDQPRVMNEWGM